MINLITMINNLTTSGIKQFAAHFNLGHSDGSIIFNATVQFKYENQSKEFNSEVHIVSVDPKHLDAIYLLNKDINQVQLPDMFKSNSDSISYIDGQCLFIFGNNANIGDFEVYIYPSTSPFVL
jgi:hypothetical protein